jgi:hypothetical protein
MEDRIMGLGQPETTRPANRMMHGQHKHSEQREAAGAEWLSTQQPENAKPQDVLMECHLDVEYSR